MVLFKRSCSSSADLNVGYGTDFTTVKMPTARTRSRSSSASSFAASSGASSGATSGASSGARTSRIATIVQFIIIGLLCFICMKTNDSINSRNKELSDLEVMVSDSQENLIEVEQQLNKANDEFHRLQITMLDGQASMPKMHYAKLSEESKTLIANGIIEKHDKQSRRIAELQKGIQQFHRAELERRFGPGPYYVEMEIKLDGMTKWLTLETAPNELMPHSVHYFLDMVDNKVWDKTVFVHNADHIVSAALMNPDGELKQESLDYHLAFPEYSEKFPHKEFTVGFVGLGPVFYINLGDNSESHGPRGNALSKKKGFNDADPCFAKIVLGKETIQLLKQKSSSAFREGGDNFIVTAINNVRMINLSEESKKLIRSNR